MHDDFVYRDRPVSGRVKSVIEWARQVQKVPRPTMNSLVGRGALVVTVTIGFLAGMVGAIGEHLEWSGQQPQENDISAIVHPQAVPQPEFQPTAPYYASFFYLWYQRPDVDGKWGYWSDHDNTPSQSWFSHYLPDYQTGVFNPASELYSSNDYGVFKWQVSKLAEARQEVAIASWWGPHSREDDAFQTIAHDYMARPDNPYPHLRWCIYYEMEGYLDENVDTLTAHLEYIQRSVAESPYYLSVGDKPVIFVYAGENDTPGTMPERWEQANARLGGYFYVVLKVFPGFEADVHQPDSWHQYAPAERSGTNGTFSAFVSPGFWLDAHGSEPRLPRNPAEFEAAVITMVDTDVMWKLVETWNEWGEGTSVEPGQKVTTNSSGVEVLDKYGPEFGNIYVDILNTHLPPITTGWQANESG